MNFLMERTHVAIWVFTYNILDTYIALIFFYNFYRSVFRYVWLIFFFFTDVAVFDANTIPALLFFDLSLSFSRDISTFFILRLKYKRDQMNKVQNSRTYLQLQSMRNTPRTVLIAFTVNCSIILFSLNILFI